jgi:hypothetical protein
VLTLVGYFVELPMTHYFDNHKARRVLADWARNEASSVRRHVVDKLAHYREESAGVLSDRRGDAPLKPFSTNFVI